MAHSDDNDTEVAAPAALRRRESIEPPLGTATEVVPPPRTASGTTGPTVASTSHGSILSPVDALRLDEVARTRRLLPMVLAMCAATAIALPLLSGDPTAKLLLYICIGLTAVSSTWLHFHTSEDPSSYTDRIVAVTWLAPTLTIVAAVQYFGAFSPAPILMVLSVYLISMGRSRVMALMVYGTCATGQAVLGILSMTDLVPDRGLMHADYLGIREQIIGLALVQVVLLSTFFSARAARRTQLMSYQALEQAIHGIAQRDAMLKEAQQDLDRAMQIGGPGKYSDTQVGSFTLGVVIGRGAMGEVYEARHTETDAEAAVKLLHPNVVGERGYVERFLREVRAANTVDSPNIVKVLEVSDDDAPFPFLAMERLRGHDLSHYLRTRRRLSRARVLALAREVGAGIEAAGNAGIVHRDIKPQNLFLHEAGADRVWKILDFGVSKLGGQGGTLTQGHVVGTPAYMAPEQAQGQDVDSRADLYALAAILYRAITGHPPFQGKDPSTTLYNVVYNMPKRPSELVDVPEDVDATLAIALAKNADERFFTADELAGALEAALDGKLSQDWLDQAERLVDKHPWGTAWARP